MAVLKIKAQIKEIIVAGCVEELNDGHFPLQIMYNISVKHCETAHD